MWFADLNSSIWTFTPSTLTELYDSYLAFCYPKLMLDSLLNTMWREVKYYRFQTVSHYLAINSIGGKKLVVGVGVTAFSFLAYSRLFPPFEQTSFFKHISFWFVVIRKKRVSIKTAFTYQSKYKSSLTKT